MKHINESKVNKPTKSKLAIQSLLIALLSLFMLNSTIAQNCGEKKTTEKKTKEEVLYKVAEAGKLEKMKILIEEKNIDINTRLKNDETVLSVASFSGHMDMVKYLVDKGIDINARNKSNSTALHHACLAGETEIASYLLEQGLEINDRGRNDNTALHFALYYENVETVKMLVSEGADVNLLNAQDRPPILIASWRGNPEIIYTLVKNGANINFATSENNTVLHNLAGAGKTKSVKIALKYGADANVVNSAGKLPVHNAVIDGYSEIVELLIPHTNDVNFKEQNLGNTPLHIASVNGDLESVKVLLAASANTGITNNAGKLPLDYAIKYGNVSVVKYFYQQEKAKEKHIQMAKQSHLDANSPVLDGQAKVTYTGHSGWIVQTADNVLIFDYLDASKSANQGLANGSFCCEQMKDKNVYVFVSHTHGDHYDTTIYSWNDKVDNITYVFGFNPEESNYHKDKGYAGPDFTFIADNTTQKVKDISITTLKSNDSGQGFLVEIDGITIYHPGDHALFTEEDKEGFVKEVDFIAGIRNDVDIAFLPVTGCPARWKKEFIVDGFFYSIDKLNPKLVYPMHAMDREYKLKEFAEMAEEKKCKAELVCVEYKGDSKVYSKNLTAIK